MSLWKLENRDEYESIVNDILCDPAVQELKTISQHSKTCNRLDHCLYVSYLSFLFCRRFGLNYVAAARAGLLHDFFFEDKEDGVRRIWQHPHSALANAATRHSLSALERDIIVKHMWPLTRPLPRYRESFVVTVADKICAALEMCRLYRLFRVHKHLGHKHLGPAAAPATVPAAA